MTVNVKRITAAGLKELQYSVRQSAGIYAVGAADTLANGADSGAVLLDGIDAFNVDIPDRRLVNTTGDDGALGQFDFDPDSLPSGTFTFGTFNASFAALADGSLVFDSGGLSQSAINPLGTTRPTFMLIATTQAKSRDAGSVGEAGFWHTVFYNVRANVKGDDGLANATGASFSGTLNMNSVDTTAWGKVLALLDEGTTILAGSRFWSPYLWSQHAFKGDAAATDFTLDYTVAEENGTTVQVWEDGVLQAYTTNYTVSGTTLTLVGAARAAGVNVQVGYGHI